MSTLILQVGQAGNQLGAHVWSRAVHQAYTAQQQRLAQQPLPSTADPLSSSALHRCLASSPFFAPSSHALAVLVDTEPKVLQSIFSLSAHSILSPEPPAAAQSPSPAPPSLFHRDSVFFDQSGRGNNWSLGYRGRRVGGGEDGDSTHSSSSSMADAVVERVRAMAERMDVFDSVLLLHSVGGGTGAGLGSLLLERLRDTFPSHFLCSASILPFQRGETPLQHYNATLSLSHLQRHCDAVLCCHNDAALDLLSALVHRGRGGAAGVAPLPFSVLNSFIADCLCDVLGPSDPLDPSLAAGESLTRPLGASLPSLLGSLCPQPRLKWLESVTSSGLVLPTAHEPLSWSSIVDTLDRSLALLLSPGRTSPPPSSSPSLVKAFAVIARGEAALPLEPWDRQRVDERLGRHFVLEGDGAAAAPPPLSSAPRLGSARLAGRVGTRLLVDSAPSPSLSSQSSSLCAVLNHARHVAYLQSTLQSCRAMLRKRAYLHWYERFDCGEEAIQRAIDCVQRGVDEYHALDRD